MIHKIATCLSVCVYWVACGCAWTAILAGIDARSITTMDSCNAPIGLCGFWLMIGGFIISSVSIWVFLIITMRRKNRVTEKLKNE